jgi:hypothetical protein
MEIHRDGRSHPSVAHTFATDGFLSATAVFFKAAISTPLFPWLSLSE